MSKKTGTEKLRILFPNVRIHQRIEWETVYKRAELLKE
jgi:hypothetical protein